jgi:CelD/BcsL family acetyltransferase involved in cellulose biosynthesis
MGLNQFMNVSPNSPRPPSVDRASLTGGLRVDVYTSWDAAGSLIPVWREILAMNPELTIFCTPEWMTSWWEAFGPSGSLRILAFVGVGEQILGLAPLYVETHESAPFGNMTRIRFVGDGSGDSDNLDLVIRPGAEGICIDAMLGWIAKNDYNLCALNTLDAESTSAKALAHRLNGNHWSLRYTSMPCSWVEFPGTYRDYFTGLSAGFRKLIGRGQRDLRATYRVKIRRCERAGEIPEMLEDLFCLHQKRWTCIGEPGSFVSEPRRRFYRKMASAFLDRGWLELWTLELDGKAAAAQMGFRYREVAYGLQEGFAPELGRFHPGYLLRAAMFESLVERGAKKYSFLAGFTAAKARWGAQCGQYANFVFAVPQTRGAYHIALDRSAAESKEWLRQHLPSQMWQILHRIKVSYEEKGRASVAATDYPDERLAS